MSSVRISLNHDTVPVELQNIQPPLLALYAGNESVPTEYHDYVSRRLDGDRNWVEVGLPYVVWTFFRLSRAEYTLLQSYTGPVSIRTLDQKDNVYRLFNGKAKEPETNSGDAEFAHDALDGFVDVKITIYDLVIQS